MMPSDKIKEILLATCLYAGLTAQPAWALTLHVTLTANPQTTLAGLKNPPDTPTRALAQIKDPALRTPAASAGTSAAGEPANSKEPFALITNYLAGAASRDLFGKDEA